MAMKKQPEAEQKQIGVPIPLEWHVPDDLIARYATNMTVQRLDNEYLISFFEVKPPIFIGEPDVIMEKLKDMKSIKAKCVAQVFVSAEKLPGFINALETALQRGPIDLEAKVEE
jgi:hypothetical protein